MIHHESCEDIAVLRMEHGKANALDLELLQLLTEALHAVEQSRARAVVLTGSGSIFSAGVDLFRVLEGGADYLRAFLPAFSPALRKLFAFQRPVVAAMNGHAMAGGYVLAAACDYRIMADGRATLGVPELLVGVPFPAAALEILRFAAGGRVQELAYTGRVLGAAEAATLGLVESIAPAESVMRQACERASQLGTIATEAFRLTKRQLRRPTLDRIDRQAAADSDVIDLWTRPETLAAIRVYLERTLRQPRAPS